MITTTNHVSFVANKINEMKISHFSHFSPILNYIFCLQSQKSIESCDFLLLPQTKLPVTTESNEKPTKGKENCWFNSITCSFWRAVKWKLSLDVFDVIHWKWWRKSHPNGFNSGFFVLILSDLNLWFIRFVYHKKWCLYYGVSQMLMDF